MSTSNQSVCNTTALFGYDDALQRVEFDPDAVSGLPTDLCNLIVLSTDPREVAGEIEGKRTEIHRRRYGQEGTLIIADLRKTFVPGVVPKAPYDPAGQFMLGL